MLRDEEWGKRKKKRVVTFSTALDLVSFFVNGEQKDNKRYNDNEFGKNVPKKRKNEEKASDIIHNKNKWKIISC